MRTVTLDCRSVQSPQALHMALQSGLDFPAWYGRNLDALYDCLTDLHQKTCLILLGWDSLGTWEQGFRLTLQDAARENAAFSVEFR